VTELGPSGRRERARRERRRSRRRKAALLVGGLVLASLVFFAGLALGRALEEGPEPAAPQTLVRTLAPGTLPPVTRTLTVTTAGP
jgi:hypothetical protein